jgi:hypothetical protein
MSATAVNPGFSRAKWPNANFEQIEAIADAKGHLADLREASPVQVDSAEPKTDEVMSVLFPGNPLLCCGWSVYRFDTRPRDRWHKLHDLQFIVPSPMSHKRGLTRKGKLSAHTQANVGPRRFLVVEFDFGASQSANAAELLARLDVLDICAALLLHLASIAPLALAVHSGGKSLHGWFYADGQPEDQLRRFMQHAVSLGADYATWNPTQFARMPDGKRQNGNRQTFFFFNPAVVK